jgi:bacteriorhodopsin
MLFLVFGISNVGFFATEELVMTSVVKVALRSLGCSIKAFQLLFTSAQIFWLSYTLVVGFALRTDSSDGTTRYLGISHSNTVVV